MRRAWLLIIVAVAAAACTGGGSDAERSTTTTAAPEPIDVVAATERYLTVCSSVFAVSDIDRCVEGAENAIEAADDAGCSLTAVDAWVEHIVAWELDSMPHDGFFDSCPLPLSNLILRTVPEGFEPTVAPAGAGLLTSAEVAEAFVDPDEVTAWLDELGHEVGYGAAWSDDDDGVVVVRLDRFETVEGATAFVEADRQAAADETGITVPGILESSVVSDADGHVAIGRVCDIALTLQAQPGGAAGLDADEVVAWFSAQALRVQSAVVC